MDIGNRLFMLAKFCTIFLLALSAVLVSVTAKAESLGLLDAVRLSLAGNPDIQLQSKQVEVSRGILQQASGQFDTALRLSGGRNSNSTPLNQSDRNTYASIGFPLSQASVYTTSYSLALDNPLRNGIVLTPSVSASRVHGTATDIVGLPVQTQGTVSFTLRVPILRGSGTAVAAAETAARLEWEASQHDLRHAVALGIVGTVATYWGLVAARKNLDVAIEAEASIRQMLAETRKLIEADEIPAADLNLVRASLLDRTTARIAAEQALLEARQRLGLATGLSHMSVATLEATEDFPLRTDTTLPAASERTRLIDMAMSRRADLAAARLREDAARTLTGSARSNLQPQLDVNLGVGYTGLAEGGGSGQLINALGQNRAGVNLGLSISYQWPFDNNVARGRYLQQASIYDQSTIRTANVRRGIGLGVEAALSGLLNSTTQLSDSEQTVELYRVTLENEKTKHRLGSATLIDVLTVNDRLLNARLSNIAYRLNHLATVVRLNFETGLLLADEPGGQLVSFDRLVNVAKYH
jgi:outer membrane protein TolC